MQIPSQSLLLKILPSFAAMASLGFTVTAQLPASAATITPVNVAADAGGGIFIGTDHNDFAYTANQILSNFGFDGLFTGIYYPTANGSFGGNLLMEPESVGTDFFTNHIQGLSTSYVPVGTHVLNENGGNRIIQIYEQLYSYTYFNGSQVVLIGTSFNDKPKSEEPLSGLAYLVCQTISLSR